MSGYEDHLARIEGEVLSRRPRNLDSHISKYEKELPEADAVYTMLADAVRERGWQRIQRNAATYGDGLPWKKMAGVFRLRPSETTIWAGPNGSMKSLQVNFILGHLAYHGSKVFVASLELTVEDQISRLVRQMLCNDYPVRSRFDRLMDRLGDNLMVYDFVGHVKPERMVALARYAGTELGAQHVLIDNLTMVVPPGRNSDEQAARFVAGLYQVGRDTGAHIHLIAHVRKPADEFSPLNRYDIRGTGAAPDMVDNVVIVQRNEAKSKKKEDDKTEEPSANGEPPPDLWMTVDKQRHGSWRGRMKFWLYETSTRLAESGLDVPQAYL